MISETKKYATNRIFFWAIAFVLLAVTAVLFVSVRQSQRVKDTAESVSHTEEILHHLQQLFLAVMDNETGARGYVITGKDQFLEPLQLSEKYITSEMNSLRQLVADNPVQKTVADSIDIYLSKRITFSNEMARLRRDSSAELAAGLVLTGKGKSYTEKIRLFGSIMEQAANEMLRERKKKNEQTISYLNIILYSVLAIGFILSIIIVLRFRSEIKTQKLSEEKFRALLNAAPDATIVITKNNLIKMINHQTENLFGYSRKELIGKSVALLIPAELNLSDKHALNLMSYAEAAPKDAAIVLKALKKNQHQFPVEITLSPLETKEGILISVSIRDITQRKITEDNLLFLASIADNILDPIISFDNNLIITRWNEAAENLFEWKSDEVVRKTTSAIFNTNYPSLSRENILELLNKNGFWRGEVIYHTKSGKPVNVLSTASKLKDAEGNMTGYLLLVKDITERKKAEEKIAYMARMVEGTGEAVYSVTPDFIIRTWNKGAEKLYGYATADVLGRPAADITGTNIPANMRRIIYEQLMEKGFWEGELLHLKKDGTQIAVLGSTTAIKNATGKMEGYVSVAKDISDRKKLEDELKKAHGEMEAFTYSVSHDLRAPLRSIIGFTAILEEDYTAKLDAEAMRITNVIKSNAAKMGDLIDDLLAFSRTGKQDLIKVEIDMRNLVQQIVENEPDKNIEWIIEPLPSVKGDVATIRQVWINLFSNAVKYSNKKQNRQIKTGAYNDGSQMVFYVKDNGVGFNDQYKDKLFKVFQRLHGADEFEGTGVGLALVEKIVSRHGGKVWAEGKINEGACFYFSLPL